MAGMTKKEADDIYARETEVKGAFSPSAPIRRKDLFAGRTRQLLDVQDSVAEPGQHAVIFGERGVGKTSLAAVCREISVNLAIKINCQAGDTFTSVWRKAFNEVRMISEARPFGFSNESRTNIISAADYFRGIDELTPDHVRVGLEMIGQRQALTVFFDEFDRLEGPATHIAFADTIKTCSDQVVPATIVIVGVADDVDELVTEHASIERALVQIYMPRMSRDELRDIIVRGFDSVEMSADETVIDQITGLSQGLPHYTHLLAQQAGIRAVWDDRDRVNMDDVDEAVRIALTKAQESLALDYYGATHSNRENMYKQVLLACALAKTDERGYFTAASVRDPLSHIIGRPMDIPAYALHLNALASDRGPILKKEGSVKKFRYRFNKPIMQPYVVMKGLADELISRDCELLAVSNIES